MTDAVDIEIRVGSRIWLDGQGWEVAAINGTSVRLLAHGCLRTVGVGQLLTCHSDPPDTEEPGKDDDRWTIPAVVLAGLSTRQQEALTRRVETLREALEPAADDDRSVAERYASAAAQLGVTRRTLERQLARFQQRGPAGLVDARMLRDVRRGVDPRWEAICVSVLARYTNRSNPTMQAVIDQTSRQFLRDHPDGVVPSRAVAYRRLEELAMATPASFMTEDNHNRSTSATCHASTRSSTSGWTGSARWRTRTTAHRTVHRPPVRRSQTGRQPRLHPGQPTVRALHADRRTSTALGHRYLYFADDFIWSATSRCHRPARMALVPRKPWLADALMPLSPRYVSMEILARAFRGLLKCPGRQYHVKRIFSQLAPALKS